MNIKDRMKKIAGVINATWNPSDLSLGIYYECDVSLDKLKLKVVDQIDRASLHRAIEKINFIRICDN